MHSASRSCTQPSAMRSGDGLHHAVSVNPPVEAAFIEGLSPVSQPVRGCGGSRPAGSGSLIAPGS
jgi:hypothetical protein